VCDTFRTLNNPVYFHHTGGQLTTSDLDTAISRHPIDGVYNVSGYGLWAALNDNVLAGGTALNPASLGLYTEYLPSNYNATTGVWADSSGNGNDATALSTKPILATGITGQQVVRFSGSALRTGTGWGLIQPTTVIFLIETINNTVTQPVIIDGSEVINRQLIQPSTTGQLRAYAGAYGTDSEMIMTAVPHVYAIEFNGTSTKVWCDGNPRYVNLAPGSNAMGGLTIGGSAAASTVNQLDGDIGYLSVYDGTLTNEQHFSIACHFRQTHNLWPLFGETASW